MLAVIHTSRSRRVVELPRHQSGIGRHDITLRLQHWLQPSHSPCLSRTAIRREQHSPQNDRSENRPHSTKHHVTPRSLEKKLLRSREKQKQSKQVDREQYLYHPFFRSSATAPNTRGSTVSNPHEVRIDGIWRGNSKYGLFFNNCAYDSTLLL